MRKKLLAMTFALVVCLGGSMSVCAADMGTGDGIPAQMETTEGNSVEAVSETTETPETESGVQMDPGIAAQANDYKGFLNTVVCGNENYMTAPSFGGTTGEWTITPCEWGSLTAAQQAAVKPLYDGMNGVTVSADRASTWPQEKQVAENFMSSIMGGSISIAGDGFFFGKVSGGDKNALTGILMADGGSGTSGFVVLQLNDDGTWKDNLVHGPWVYTMPTLGVPQTDQPVLICLTAGTGSRRVLYSAGINASVSAIANVNGVNIGLSVGMDVRQSAHGDFEKALTELENRFSGADYTAQPEEGRDLSLCSIMVGFLGEQGVTVNEVISWGSMDINATGIDMSAGVPITFKADGIAAGDQVIVLHLKADGTWERISDATAGNGTITGTFTSLSPVFYFKVTMPGSAVTPPASDNAAGTAGTAAETHSHTWTETVVAPTATTWGYTMYGCNECGYSYADNYVAPTAAGAAAQARAVSPKTGESRVPYAVTALICMMGAGLAVTRCRYTAGK